MYVQGCKSRFSRLSSPHTDVHLESTRFRIRTPRCKFWLCGLSCHLIELGFHFPSVKWRWWSRSSWRNIQGQKRSKMRKHSEKIDVPHKCEVLWGGRTTCSARVPTSILLESLPQTAPGPRQPGSPTVLLRVPGLTVHAPPAGCASLLQLGLFSPSIPAPGTYSMLSHIHASTQAVTSECIALPQFSSSKVGHPFRPISMAHSPGRHLLLCLVSTSWQPFVYNPVLDYELPEDRNWVLAFLQPLQHLAHSKYPIKVFCNTENVYPG